MTGTPTTFYDAFSRLDHQTMAACYANDAHFTDPVFDVRGQEIGAMWRMLCSSSTDLSIEYEILDQDHSGALVDWKAIYTFPPTRRLVHNEIRAQMSIQDGLITRHADTFSFYRWSRQAFGLTGFLLGWAPPFRSRVRSTAMRNLRRSST